MLLISWCVYEPLLWVDPLCFDVNTSSGSVLVLLTNPTLSERVCIREVIQVNLMPTVTFELIKYENLCQVQAGNWWRNGGHFGCITWFWFCVCLYLPPSANFVFVSSSFSQFCVCIFLLQTVFLLLPDQTQSSFLMLVKTAHNCL